MCNLTTERNNTIKGLNLMKRMLDSCHDVLGEYGNDGVSLVYDYNVISLNIIITYCVSDRKIFSVWDDRENDEIKEEVENESLKNFLEFYPKIRKEMKTQCRINDYFFGGIDKIDDLENTFKKKIVLKL